MVRGRHHRKRQAIHTDGMAVPQVGCPAVTGNKQLLGVAMCKLLASVLDSQPIIYKTLRATAHLHCTVPCGQLTCRERTVYSGELYTSTRQFR